MFTRACSARKKIKVPLKLFSVVWVPDVETKVLTIEDALEFGGCIVETKLSRLEANESKRRFNIEMEGLDGIYLKIGPCK